MAPSKTPTVKKKKETKKQEDIQDMKLFLSIFTKSLNKSIKTLESAKDQWLL